MDNSWSVSDIMKYFHMNSRHTIMAAEQRGEIPESRRSPNGNRYWNISQIPEIGLRYGFLEKPKIQKTLAVYTPKGGVGKTYCSYTLARTAALNGIKTLVIDLDFQSSLTKWCLPQKTIETIEEIQESYGLYHYFFEKIPLNKIIQKTEVPTFDIIPATTEITLMTKKIRTEVLKEYMFRDKLISQLSEYELIVLDHGAGWSDLVETSLAAAEYILCPAGCESECYLALRKNLDQIIEYGKAVKHEWKDFIILPTFLENTKISQLLYVKYINDYPELSTTNSIKKNVAAQEARMSNMSILEFKPKSDIADQFFVAIKEIWDRINK